MYARRSGHGMPPRPRAPAWRYYQHPAGGRSQVRGQPHPAIGLGQEPAGPAGAAPPGAPDVVTWDPTGSQQPTKENPLERGCPPGYAPQFVEPGTPGAVDYGNPAAWIRCRLVRTATAAAIRRETGGHWRLNLHFPDFVGGFTWPAIAWGKLALASSAILGVAAFAYGFGRSR
jgi:hypothetical protein